MEIEKSMNIAVASGKGGTGKTTVATNLALSIQDVQFIDCDVEEPNANIFFNAEINEQEDVAVEIPEIDKEKCDYCGKGYSPLHRPGGRGKYYRKSWMCPNGCNRP